MGILNAASKFRRTFVQFITPSKKNDRVSRLKEEFMGALDRSRPRGIELPHDASEPEERRDVALAVEALLKEKPGVLKVIRTGKSLSLYYAVDLDPLISEETRKATEMAGMLVNSGKVL